MKFTNTLLLTVCMILAVFSNVYAQDAEDSTTFTVLSYNIWYPSDEDGTIKTIREADPDVVGLQEVSEARLRHIAEAADYPYHHHMKNDEESSDRQNAVLSKYPIIYSSGNGVQIKIDGEIVRLFNQHLTAYPYEPYDFRDDKIHTEQEAIASAADTRLDETYRFLSEVSSLIYSGEPVILVGDFNEPSHLDWTERAADHFDHMPTSVEWPTSRVLHEAGFRDAYREVYPDEIANPGFTWTPAPTENEIHDRIDRIYFMGSSLKVAEVSLVGIAPEDSDIQITDYPSDHRGVLGRFILE